MIVYPPPTRWDMFRQRFFELVSLCIALAIFAIVLGGAILVMRYAITAPIVTSSSAQVQLFNTAGPQLTLPPTPTPDIAVETAPAPAPDESGTMSETDWVASVPFTSACPMSWRKTADFVGLKSFTMVSYNRIRRLVTASFRALNKNHTTNPKGVMVHAPYAPNGQVAIQPDSLPSQVAPLQPGEAKRIWPGQTLLFVCKVTK